VGGLEAAAGFVHNQIQRLVIARDLQQNG